MLLRAAVALGCAALLLAAANIAAQPTPLVLDDRRGPEARGRPSRVAAEHPWVPDVMDLVGVRDPGSPIRVLLVPESSPLAREVPAWVAGYFDEAVPDTVVLLASRTPPWPDGGLEEVLAHEVAHVLLLRAAGGRPVPRWFNEGVAMTAGRSWGMEDRARVALVLLSGGKVPLHRLDPLFRGDGADVERAYALSGALVQELVSRYGPGLPRGLLFRVSQGASFEEALRQVTGLTLLDLQESFFSRQASWGRWATVLTSAAVLWLGITLLALVAGARRRRRHREQLARLAAEEDAAGSHPGSDPGDFSDPCDHTVN